ncbi:uncharacterized protein EAE98_008751 [Botrytis deweyae]|uniref:Uncharacterized protein n=1 Tax=Botrytis deweyae TaxID=2478750 RepID=A0ABQ7ID16_9HELO|nr:uncharacterized protein EAE98_008751 [Botrytis deweyae]KAF7920722.1 hypothetical protein EAE98_008751 [Botrytis deweyae]
MSTILRTLTKDRSKAKSAIRRRGLYSKYRGVQARAIMTPNHSPRFKRWLFTFMSFETALLLSPTTH